MNYSIVVPLYNEGPVVKELVRRLVDSIKSFGSFEIIIVNDGSTDNTQEELEKSTEEYKELIVISLTRNYGQTAALAAGIDYASGKIIITMDGDLQHRPEEIHLFIEKMGEGYDIVNGSRFDRPDNLISRRIPSWVANCLARKIAGLTIKDFGSTFKSYRAELLKKIELFGELHRFIPVLATRLGAKITEVPITVEKRKEGKSNYGIGRTFGVMEDLFFLLFYSHYLTKPIRAFGFLFFLFFGAGFLISVWLMLQWLFGTIGAVWEHASMLLFSVFLMIVGVQFLVAGVIAELLTRIYHKTGEVKIYSIDKVIRS